MDAVKPGITTTNNNPTCTDVVPFQEAVGNAVAGLAVFNQTRGFSHLVDTTERFQKRDPAKCNNIKPIDMPTPPSPLTREERKDKTARTLYKQDLKEYKQTIHMKTIGLAQMTETFPNCLDLKETSFGCPPDFHLKDAPACVPDDTTSGMEQDNEFA